MVNNVKTTDRIRIFVDMDGTLARFHDEVQYLERMFEKDFFRNLKPFENCCQAISNLACDNKVEVFILSATVDGEPPYCKAEKHAWIDRYLPNIDEAHRIFTQVGKNKADYIPNGIKSTDILLDDYTKNLIEWQASGGIGLKAKNNINCKGLYGEVWNGDIVDITDEPDSIVSRLNELCLEPTADEPLDLTDDDLLDLTESEGLSR